MNAFLPPMIINLQATNDSDAATVELVTRRDGRFDWRGTNGEESGVGSFTKAIQALDAAIATWGWMIEQQVDELAELAARIDDSRAPKFFARLAD